MRVSSPNFRRQSTSRHRPRGAHDRATVPPEPRAVTAEPSEHRVLARHRTPVHRRFGERRPPSHLTESRPMPPSDGPPPVNRQESSWSGCEARRPTAPNDDHCATIFAINKTHCASFFSITFPFDLFEQSMAESSSSSPHHRIARRLQPCRTPPIPIDDGYSLPQAAHFTSSAAPAPGRPSCIRPLARGSRCNSSRSFVEAMI